MTRVDQIKWPTRITLTTVRSKTIRLILMCLGFVALGVLLFVVFNALWLALLLIVVFGTLATLIAVQLDKPSHLTFTADGFEQNILGRVKSYRWDEVSEFSTFRARNGLISMGSYVTFSKLDDADKIMESVARSIGAGSQSLSDNFGMKTKDLTQIMNQYRTDAINNAPKSRRKII